MLALWPPVNNRGRKWVSPATIRCFNLPRLHFPFFNSSYRYHGDDITAYFWDRIDDALLFSYLGSVKVGENTVLVPFAQMYRRDSVFIIMTSYIWHMITYSGSSFKWQRKMKINEYYTRKWIIWKRVNRHPFFRMLQILSCTAKFQPRKRNVERGKQN